VDLNQVQIEESTLVSIFQKLAPHCTRGCSGCGSSSETPQ
jgi:hypothetical protein